MENLSSDSYFTSQGDFVFHETDSDNLPDIQENGIKCDRENAYDSKEIIRILNDLGYSDPFVFDRDEVVYCHTDSEFVKDMLNRQEEQQEQGLETKDSVFVVVAVNRIDSPMYLANMSIITDLIDYQYAGTEHMMYADSPEQVVEKYKQSITEVDSPEEIRKHESAENGHTELVVDGDIPQDAIVDAL